MLRVSDEVKALFKSDNVHKDIEIRIPDASSGPITIHNDDILCETLELDEGIESGNNLSFMGCIASSFKVETVDITDDIEGLSIEVDMFLPDIEDPIPIFRGTIDTVTNTSHEEYSTEIRAYDALYKICNADVTGWYNSLAFPITIKNMRDSFFQQFGIVQEEDYLPNDPMTVNKTIEDAVINGSKIIKPLCQINGRFGRIGRNGMFQYVHLVEGTEAIYPAEDLYPDDELYPHDENAVDSVSKAHYISVSFENYDVEPINMVQLVGKDGSIVASAGERVSIQNVFTVKDNPLIYNKSSSELSTVVQNLYSTVRGLWYRPATITCIGLPYVECGDFVLMAARRSIIRAYVLTRKLKGVQSLKDDYMAKGDRRQAPYIPSIRQQVNANSNAIRSEISRAQGAENSLNQGLGQANERISRVDADLGNFKQVEAGHISALSADIQTANVQTLNAATVYANQVGSEARAVAQGYFNQLNASKLSTNELGSKFSQLSLVSFKSMNGNNITVSDLTARSATVNGRNVDSRFTAIESYITRFGAAMREHGWSY